MTQRIVLEKFWDIAHVADTQHLRDYVWQSRVRLDDDPTAPRFILTEPDVGYRSMVGG